MNAREVRVELGERAYTVHIGPGALLSVPAEIRKRLGTTPRRAFVVRDSGVPAVFFDELAALLSDAELAVSSIELVPTEQSKSIATLERVLAAMASSGHSRADPVVALGGGIVGDLAGFAAASYQRGVPVVQCPTTLLAMVDASVGGKTGVNLRVANDTGDRLLKNFVGAFHQPLTVAADTRVLMSLPDRHRRAGLAECVKHAMIALGITGADLMSETRAAMPGVLAGEEDAYGRLIERSVALKGEVVRRDERESIAGLGGVRMLLNLGHTFGHAIETIPNLSPNPAYPELAPLHHGEAVGLGLLAACRCAERLGMCEPGVGDEVLGILDMIGLPSTVRDLPDTDEVRSRMGADKKAAGGKLRLVLPEGRGRCRVVTNPDETAVAAGIDAIRG
ncbi:MAG: 3-dehydroquinate synthase [Planctomycetota bacterium]|nr:MAG: 3-dehydroquinate synthase [Planctomycetota bacterium]